MNGLPDLAPEMKAQALEEVLKSEAFLRSDQLRSFLRFICEMEVSGRAAEVSEYSIAVRALGRPAGFVPSEDTIVRNRAHALRQRLASFYAKEGSGSAVRIELAKGSYVPRFVSIPQEAAGSQDRLERKRISKIGIGLVAGAVLLGAVLSVMLIARFRSTGADRTLREAWGPLAAPDANAILVVGVPAHLLIRVYPRGAHPSNEGVDLSASAPVAEFHDERSPRREGEELHMHTSSALRFGEAMAALTMGRALGSMGASYQVVPDTAIKLSTLRSRNAILIGDPTLTPIIGQELQRTPFWIEFDASVGDFVIKERAVKAGQPLMAAPDSASRGRRLRQFPGLLTVLPSDDAPGGNKKTVIVACTNSAGCQGGAEFFSSPQSMRELRARFVKEGINGFPRAYQVVLKCQSDNVALLSFSYVAHRVLDRSVR